MTAKSCAILVHPFEDEGFSRKCGVYHSSCTIRLNTFTPENQNSRFYGSAAQTARSLRPIQSTFLVKRCSFMETCGTKCRMETLAASVRLSSVLRSPRYVEIFASVETFGYQLSQVRHIIICGHYGCGLISTSSDVNFFNGWLS